MSSRPEVVDEGDWEAWLRAYFPAHVGAPFAEHHAEFWRWVWAIGDSGHAEPIPAVPTVGPGEAGAPKLGGRTGMESDVRAFVAIWPRGGAKSTSAELATAAVGARGTRRYALYVSRTQDQANQHVAAIAACFESSRFGKDFAKAADRRIGKYGQSKGWTQTRLRSQGGFAVDAVSLEKGVRGAKDEAQRPDLIILDDIDDHGDSPDQIKKNIEEITRAILPTGSTDSVVLAVQNLVHRDGVFARLADGRADYLLGRHVSGPVPAVLGLEYQKHAQPDGTSRYAISHGSATWAGQPLAICESQINEWGLQAFLEEAQHEVGAPLGGMFDHVDFPGLTRPRREFPTLVRRVVWCDPAVTAGDHSDSHGVVSAGMDKDGKVYMLRAFEGRVTPGVSIRMAIEWAVEDGAGTVGIETDYGGLLWRSVYQQACHELGLVPHLDNEAQPVIGPGKVKAPRFVHAKAGSTQMSKAERVSRILPDMEQGRVVFSESCSALINGFKRFPVHKPFDVADAGYWCWADLRKPVARFTPATAVVDRGYGARGAEEMSPWERVKQMQEGRR